MCRRVECKKCGRPTFAGCGAHVEQVLGDVPAADRCRCREAKHRDDSERGDAADGSWWSRLIGRSSS